MSTALISSATLRNVALAVPVLLGLYLTSLYSYLLFHTAAEMFSIVIAYGIFLIGWSARPYIKNNYLVFIAVAYFFIATLDLLHTLSFKGMNIFQDYDYYANQVWIATRYLESISLLAAYLFLAKKRKLQPHVVFGLYTVITAAIVASIFYWKIFPECFITGVGQTPFKIYSEYVICLILLVDIVLLIRLKHHFHEKVYRYLLYSLGFTILSELSFTFYISNYDFSNLVGHYFKIFSFYCIYKAIIETGLRDPYDLIFKELVDRKSVV